jgi:hypothetical protein
MADIVVEELNQSKSADGARALASIGRGRLEAADTLPIDSAWLATNVFPMISMA